MKYTKLSKEQFEELNEEFAVFLAAQSIDVKEWTKIKEEKPELADKEMEVFSDFVWEKVLNKANYLEHFSKDALNLFKCGKENIQRIVVKVNKEGNRRGIKISEVFPEVGLNGRYHIDLFISLGLDND